jgi:hypothetical protein
MSATAVCEEQAQVRRERRPFAGPAGQTLGQVLARAREGVQASVATECPVCGGVMERAGVQAACASCGSRLS